MPTIPRIARAIPQGPITEAAEPIQVVVCIRWHDGEDTDVLAHAIAWTRTEVRVVWDAPAGMGRQTDWVPARDVRRNSSDPAPPAPPSSRGRARRPRW